MTIELIMVTALSALIIGAALVILNHVLTAKRQKEMMKIVCGDMMKAWTKAAVDMIDPMMEKTLAATKKMTEQTW